MQALALSAPARAYAQFTIRVPHRAAVQAKLTTLGIPTAIHYPIPLNKQPAVASDAVLPIGDKVAEEVISLPMHPYLSQTDVQHIVTALAQALNT